MEHPPIPEQPHPHPGTFPFADLGSEFKKKPFDIPPFDVAAHRPKEDQLQCTFGLSAKTHTLTVLHIGTIDKVC